MKVQSLTLATWLAAALLPAQAVGVEMSVRMVPSEAPQVMFDWDKASCSRWHIPDTPARAWRGASGEVGLILGAEETRVMRGHALNAIAAECAVVLAGRENPDPAARRDRWWIASVYPAGDSRIEALVHAEYHGHAHAAACDSAEYLTCWRNAILQAVSTDDGRSFTVDTDTPVAMLPYPYDPAQQGRTGYFSPSNLLELDGFLYVFVHAAAYRDQRHGVCLLRRPVAGTSADWRAWDGTGFTIHFVDPYFGTVAEPAQHVCTPLDGLRGNLTSVVARNGVFLAVSPMGHRGSDGNWIDGFWTLRSNNLIDWSAPDLLMEVPLLWRRDCDATFTYAYPAFLDPDSATENFQTVDDRFWLTYVRMALTGDCHASPNRDLLRREVVWPR